MRARRRPGTRLLALLGALAAVQVLVGVVAVPAAADPPANDEIEDATPVGALPFTASQDSLEATRSPSDPRPSCRGPDDYTVWYAYTPAEDGAIAVLTSGGDGFPPTPVVFTGPPGATSSTPLTEVACRTFGPLHLPVVGGTTYYIRLASLSPRPEFTLTVQPLDPPANDQIEGATPVRALPFTATQDTLTATRSPSDREPSCGAPNDYTVWYTYTPTEDDTIAVLTSGADGFPPTSAVFTGPPGATSSTPLAEVACQQFGPVQVDVEAGRTYYVMLGSSTPRPAFTVEVQPVRPLEAPTITAPPIRVGNDPERCGASVEYDGLVVTGNPAPSTSMSPPSGSFFDVGTTTVQVFARNSAGSASATFTVTVSDTEAPVLVAPDPITVDATSPSGAVVEYAPFLASDNCPGVAVTSTPPSGSTFPIGATVVTGTATDEAGNETSATLVVHVTGAEEQLATLSEDAVGISPGRGLQVRLDRAEDQLARGRPGAACHALANFIAAVTVQTPRHIDPTDAEPLIRDATRIRSVLGCPSPLVD